MLTLYSAVYFALNITHRERYSTKFKFGQTQPRGNEHQTVGRERGGYDCLAHFMIGVSASGEKVNLAELLFVFIIVIRVRASGDKPSPTLSSGPH